MIRVLPQHVINKIAAGEVVERPASVVKELIENAVDAGASLVTVSLWGNAVGGIEVGDDGCGMDEKDAALCIEHHATSKITDVDDLSSIRTLGFRGEALSSIAAVSKLTLITSKGEGGEGLRICAEAGKITASEPAASARGTRIRVEHLFYNVPARLKFLRSVRTEEALVAETVRNLALACPSVAFRYRKEGKESMSLPAGDEAQRVAEAMKGRRLFFAGAEGAGVSLRAYLTPPEDARRGAGGLILIVNGRCVADRAVAAAVAAAHEGLLEKGRYPEGVLLLELPPGDLDVNVHPQKREVRFASPSALFGFIRKNISEALAKAPWLPSPPAAQPMPAPPATPSRAAEQPGPYVQSPPRLRGAEAAASFQAAPLAPAQPAPALLQPRGFFSSLVPVAQVFSTYIVCENEDGIVIIDQHAAAERVTYEKLRRQYREGSLRLQSLLIPELVQMEEKDVAAVEDNEGLLKSLGIDASVSGDDCVTVRAIPSILGNVNPAALVKEIAGLTRSLSGRTEEVVESILQTMACHGSIRAGRALEREEMAALLDELQAVDFSTHCPHGRPVHFTLPRREIEAKLGRR